MVVDDSEIDLYISALQTASRDWLETCQKMNEDYSATSVSSELRTCIRLARSQPSALDLSNIEFDGLAAALEASRQL